MDDFCIELRTEYDNIIYKFRIVVIQDFKKVKVRREYKIYFLSAVLISFILPVTSIFIYYSNRTVADVTSPGLYFENPDQDNSWAGDKDESRVLGLTVSPDSLLSGGNLLKKVPRRFSETPSFDQKTIILRC